MNLAGSQQQERHDAWGVLRPVRTSSLRGEAKLAFEDLWRLAGGRAGAVMTVAAGYLASLQGTSERSGTRALEALAEGGWIVKIAREGTKWVIEVQDPVEVAKAHLIRRQARPQLEFPELADASAREEEGVGGCAADVAPLPPIANQYLSNNISNKTRTLPNEDSQLGNGKQLLGLGLGGNDTRSAESRDRGRDEGPRALAATRLGEALAGVVAEQIPDAARQTERVAQLASWIAGRLGTEPKSGAHFRAAQAIVNGDYPPDKLHQVLRTTDQHASDKAAYFTRAVERSMHDENRSLR